ncbi:hypothetical protein CW304_26790 [Bacillus sp. UFRGS-B20]|nr:hypothetical protein CW304_26790 [Bacillus sp. UFRGS-B20]
MPSISFFNSPIACKITSHSVSFSNIRFVSLTSSFLPSTLGLNIKFPSYLFSPKSLVTQFCDTYNLFCVTP